MPETFRPLQDLEGLYEISDLGRIKSVARTVTQTLNGTTFTRFFKERFLKPTPNSHGYYQFKPCRNGKTTTLKVARAVAEHFLWNPDNKPEVNHKNGDKSDNSVGNLEWVTSLEQQEHALATGLRVMPQWSKETRTRLTRRKVCRILALLSRGYPQKRIRERFHVTSETVRGIARREHWKDVPDLWSKTT